MSIRKKIVVDNVDHREIIKNGVETWNRWRSENPHILPLLSGVDLSKADLSNANLNGADLSNATFKLAYLINTQLVVVKLIGADLREANLRGSNLMGADLSNANLSGVNLTGANLTGANLTGATLREANLRGTDLRGATLDRTDLSLTNLHETNFEEAKLLDCKVYGTAGFILEVENLIQEDLIISRDLTSLITVDNIEVAQFLSLLLNSQTILSLIDTLKSNLVLILGRFTERRQDELDAIRNELRRQNYTPILIDFEKPAESNLSEKIITLVRLSSFVIMDLSDPIISSRVISLGEKLLSVPIQAIYTENSELSYSPAIYDHLKQYPDLLEIFRYHDKAHLIASLDEYVIKPAQAKMRR